MEISEDSINRLSLGLIDKHGYSPEEALQNLRTFRIVLKAGPLIQTSVPLQAAFITAVNSGVRAFLGGVFINLPDHTPCLLPWENDESLNAISECLGATKLSTNIEGVLTLTFGLSGNINENIVEVVASDWQGGVLVNGEILPGLNEGTLPLGGIYAGGLAIGLAFMKIAKIQPQSLDKSIGLSLWRPDLNWLDVKAKGPKVYQLPEKIWMLGIGHLGQAYLWSLGLLPFSKPEKVEIYLQDFDIVVEANLSAGLLCMLSDVSKHKTRVASSWLESRKFRTRISERRFNEFTKRELDEPYLALCGFDNAKSRRLLTKAGFDLVIESALGEDSSNFDSIILHTFPSELYSPEIIWNDTGQTLYKNERILNAISKGEEKVCGILEQTIAGKAVSASFVGACSGALVIAEVLKALNGGLKCDKLVSQLRFTDDTRTSNKSANYTVELARNGYQSQKAEKML